MFQIDEDDINYQQEINAEIERNLKNPWCLAFLTPVQKIIPID